MLLGSGVVSAARVTPVEKVTRLLIELQAKVVAEGKGEAKTYDKFACFCKDQSKAKNDSIDDNRARRQQLSADLDTENSNRDTADTDISDTEDAIAELERKLKEEMERRAKEHKLYEVSVLDLQTAEKALKDAIKVLKSSKGSSESAAAALVQVKSTVSQAILLSDALGLKHATPALMQLADDRDDTYNYHSDDIIETLEGLRKDFTDQKDSTMEDEENNKSTHDKFVNNNRDETRAKNVELKQFRKERATAIKKIGEHMKDLSTANFELDRDAEYLQKLTDNCNAKKEMWDHREKMRIDELTALSQAVSIIDSKVADKAAGSLRSKKNMGDTHDFSEKLAETHDEAVNLVQIHAVSKGFLAARDPRAMVLELLNSKSAQLKSAVLASLSSHAKSDPLAKVKKLVEELILRLQEEASQEASHNGWCVKNTKLATDRRSNEVAAAQDANTAMAENEVKRDEAREKIDKLNVEIDNLNTALTNATQLHKDETEEMQQAIDDAKAGKTAVDEATKVLRDFYDKAKTDSKSQADKAAEDKEHEQDSPDAGFDNEDSYAGDQETATGIFGMLEVITSDFVRTMDENTKAKAEATASFNQYASDTNGDIEAKTQVKTNEEAKETAAKKTISEENTNLKNAMAGVASATTELVELHEACNGGGQTYEERVQKRKDEVEALKDAYGILDNYAA